MLVNTLSEVSHLFSVKASWKIFSNDFENGGLEHSDCVQFVF